jgi:hypothetical protein
MRCAIGCKGFSLRLCIAIGKVRDGGLAELGKQLGDWLSHPNFLAHRKTPPAWFLLSYRCAGDYGEVGC